MKLSDRHSTYQDSFEMPHRSPFLIDTVGHFGKAFLMRKSQKITWYFLKPERHPLLQTMLEVLALKILSFHSTEVLTTFLNWASNYIKNAARIICAWLMISASISPGVNWSGTGKKILGGKKHYRQQSTQVGLILMYMPSVERWTQWLNSLSGHIVC